MYIYICVIIIIYTHEIAFFVVCPILRPEEKLQALTGAHWRDVCVLFFFLLFLVLLLQSLAQVVLAMKES